MNDDEAELRVELLKSELSVLYAHRQATGIPLKVTVREMVLEWSRKKKHEWIVGCRVAGINPDGPDMEREYGSDVTGVKPERGGQ